MADLALENKLVERRKRLKELIFASMLLDGGDFKRVCEKLDLMNEAQLDSAESLFLRVNSKKESLWKSIGSLDAMFFPKMKKGFYKIAKTLNVQSGASLLRDVLKTNIQK